MFMKGVSLTHPVLAGFIFILGISLTYLVLASFLLGEFLLHILCWHHFSVGSFSYTSRAGFFFFFLNLGSSPDTSHAYFIFLREYLLHIPCWLLFFLWGVSLTDPVLASFFPLGSFSYRSRAGFIWGISTTHPVLASFLSREFFLHPPSCPEFLLHIPSSLYFFCGEFFLHVSCFFFNLERFSFISHAGYIFIWGVSLTHPTLVSFLSVECLLHIPCWLGDFLLNIPFGFIFKWGVSLTHPLVPSFFLKIPWWVHFYMGSFSYTSCAGFLFIWAVSLTHPMLASFLSGEFLLHIPYCLHFYLGSFSYTSLLRVGKFLLHIPCWALYVGYFSYISMLASLCW